MLAQAPLYKVVSSRIDLPERLEGDEVFACAEPSDALRWGGLWPDGYPSRLVKVQADGELTLDGMRAFAPAFDVIGLVNPADALADFSKVFVDLEEEMYAEQHAWRRALRRDGNDEDRVRELLDLTLHARGLKLWGVQRFASVEQLRTAVDPAAFYTWGAVHAQAAFEQWRDEAVQDPAYETSLRSAWTAWYLQDFWDDPDIAADPDSNAEVRWDVWDAWAALTVYYTVEEGWVELPADVLSRGLREAYGAGLGMAAPVGSGVLGYAMGG